MTARRNPWMDLLRIAAVVMVVLYHSTSLGPQTYPQFVARHLVFAHQIGASLLLVLSAYLAAGAMADPARATIRWWFSRAARLLPGFVVGTVLAALALDWLAPAGMYRVGVPDLLANLAVLWNWNGYHHWDYVDGSYWTLPLQLMVFSLAPWLPRSRLGHGRGLRALLWAAVLVPLAQWPLAQGAGGTDTRGLVTDPWSVIGVGLGVVALLLVVRLGELGIDPPRALVIPARRLAGISFGIYLVHQTLGYVLMLRLQEWIGAGPGLQTVAMLAQAVLLGAAVTRWVERPAHRALLQVFDRRTARASTGTLLSLPRERHVLADRVAA